MSTDGLLAGAAPKHTLLIRLPRLDSSRALHRRQGHWCSVFSRKQSRQCALCCVLPLLAVALLWSLHSATSGNHLLVAVQTVENVYSSSIAQSASLPSSPPPLPALKTLIVVAGHAIYTGPSRSSAKTSSLQAELTSESNWVLEPYQRDRQPVSIVNDFLTHIRVGVGAAVTDKDALLIFSGGVTRGQSYGPMSEAQSYWMAAEADRWAGALHIRQRAMVEDYARDSFENLLFSICRFKEIAGSYPQHISLISYPRKRNRFVNLHRKAIGFPIDRFTFMGLDALQDQIDMGIAPSLSNYTKLKRRENSLPVKDTKFQALKSTSETTTDPESVNNLVPFTNDPYACFLPTLIRKKVQRNWGNRQHGYEKSCPELHELLTMCNTPEGQQGKLYNGKLPW